MSDTSPSRPAFAEELDRPFELRQLREHLDTVGIALRRHAALATVAFLAVAALTGVGLALMPRVYVSHARVLVQRNEQGLNLGEVDRNFWREVQPPAQGAVDLLRARPHLEKAVDDLGLVAALHAGRPPVRRAIEALLGAPRDAAAARAMTLEVLDKRVKVELGPDGTAIDLEVSWSDPAIAARIADSLLQSYLAARQGFEVGLLEGRLRDIEQRADAAGVAVASALETSRAEYARSLAELEQSVRGSAGAPATPAERELARIKSDLVARRQAIADYEELQRRARSELQAKLRAQQAALADDHPDVRETQAALAASAEEPPPLAELRAQERELFQRYLARGGKDPSLVETGPLRAVTEAMLAGARIDRDPALGQARSELDAAQEQYRRLRTRLDAAKLELEAMRASFGQRYVVVQPAQVPLRAARPDTAAALAGAALVGAALALFLALAAHLREGRIHRAWQIRRALRVPVLSEVRARRVEGPVAEARRA